MKRDLPKFTNTVYDLLIIGGGVTGACAAWDASLRGLSVALVDKGDFGAATSAASGKIIHGGIRYIQYGALRRVRESLHERMVFQKIAPQFIHPIPFLVPTYGHFLRGKEILAFGMTLYDLLAFDKRNSGDPEKIIPRHRELSRSEVLHLAPNLIQDGLTGGILYHDCQMHNPERLTLGFILSAHEMGADLANYVKAFALRRSKDCVTEVKVRDTLTGEAFDIRARVVLNASGPWIQSVLATSESSPPFPRARLSKGIHIITRPLIEDCALALVSKQRHAGAFIQRGGRHFFIIPWRNRSIIGTTNAPFDGSPDEKMVTETDIQGLIQELNATYPAALKREDVLFFYGGLYPDNLKKSIEEGYQGAREDQLLVHAATEGKPALISAIGVKYTTARKLAQKTIDLVFKMLGHNPPKCLTETIPIHGGKIESFSDFLTHALRKNGHRLREEIILYLLHNYGSRYTGIMRYIDLNPHWREKVHPDLPIIKAQVIHAVREEMGQKLTDVVFRRTGLGTLGDPGKASLQTCASLMADELGWDAQRTQSELMEVGELFRPA